MADTYVSFRRIRSTGAWGIHGPAAQVIPGRRVTARRVDETTEELTVGRIVWRSRYAPFVAIAEIAPNAAPVRHEWRIDPIFNGRGDNRLLAFRGTAEAGAYVEITQTGAATYGSYANGGPNPTDGAFTPARSRNYGNLENACRELGNSTMPVLLTILAPPAPGTVVNATPTPVVNGNGHGRNGRRPARRPRSRPQAEGIRPEAAELRRPCLLIYDVPTGVPVNPCNRLRRIGVHLQLSGWVVPEDKLPMNYLNSLTELGVTWDYVRFDDSEIPKLVARAEQAIARETQQIAERLAESMERAGTAYEAPAEGDPNVRRRNYLYRVDAAAKSARKRLEDLDAARAVFGLPQATIDMTALQGRVGTLRAAAHARAASYAAMTEAVRAVDPALADAAEADAVPAGQLADRLLDADAISVEDAEMFTME